MSQAPLLADTPAASQRAGSFTRLPQADSVAAFGLRTSRHFAQCRREGGQLALVWIEVDMLGRADGGLETAEHDALIQTVSLRLRNRVRGSDEVVYMAGNSFAVLLLAAGVAEARLVEQRLLQALRGAYCVDSRVLQLGVRLGTAVFPQAGRNGAELAEAARENLALRS